MPSIRRSLIAYFLLLLGATLAGVAILYDRLASEAVQERKNAELQLIRQKQAMRNHDANEKFNGELLLSAKALSREFRQKYFLLANRPPDPNFVRKFQLAMGVVPLGYGLNPLATTAVSYATNNGSFRNSVFWSYLAPPVLDEVIRQSLENDDHTGVYQIHMPRLRQPIRPTSQTVLFPLDSEAMDRASPLSEEYYRFDDIDVVSDATYRRIIYRPPFWTYRVPRSGGSRSDGGGRDRDRDGRGGAPRTGPPRPDAGPKGPNTTEFQAVYVQYARKKTEIEAILSTHEQTAQEEKEHVIATTQIRLSWLRTWLTTIGLVAFVSMVAGGWILIGRGLAPLAKLSEAVSRISPTDFRLPIESRELSEELLPIHDRLTQTLDALRRAFEREKQSVADISHELRTPLAALQTTIEVCLRKPRDVEKYRETLADCHEIGLQLNKLVNRILTLANLDSGNDRQQIGEFNLAQLVQECAAIIRPLADANNIDFQSFADPSLDLVSDPDMLREVLMNLLHNAVEYNRDGGSIQLQAEREPQTGQIKIEVSDTGIGMTPEVQSKIFERFYRADLSRTATGIHAGLGLSLVREYVSRLQGTIEVESTPDVGTTFRVLIPGSLASSEGQPQEAVSAVTR